MRVSLVASLAILCAAGADAYALPVTAGYPSTSAVKRTQDFKLKSSANQNRPSAVVPALSSSLSTRAAPPHASARQLGGGEENVYVYGVREEGPIRHEKSTSAKGGVGVGIATVSAVGAALTLAAVAAKQRKRT